MAKRHLIIAETKLGSSDRGYDLRFWFADKAEANAYAKRLGKAAQMAYMLDKLDSNRRGEDHDAWAAAALKVLQGLDPKAEVGVKYEVKSVDEFVASVEPEPANALEQMLRAMRDAV